MGCYPDKLIQHFQSQEVLERRATFSGGVCMFVFSFYYILISFLLLYKHEPKKLNPDLRYQFKRVNDSLSVLNVKVEVFNRLKTKVCRLNYYFTMGYLRHDWKDLAKVGLVILNNSQMARQEENSRCYCQSIM